MMWHFAFMALLITTPCLAGTFKVPQIWQHDFAWNDLTTRQTETRNGDYTLGWIIQPTLEWNGIIYAHADLNAHKRTLKNTETILADNSNPMAFSSGFLRKKIVGHQPWFYLEFYDEDAIKSGASPDDAQINGWIPGYNEAGKAQLSADYGPGC